MRKPTELEKELIDELRKIKDDRDFIIGVISDLESDDEYKQMLHYIRSFTEDDPVTSVDVIVTCLEIRDNRKK